MRKILTLLLLFTFIFTLNGCAQDVVIDIEKGEIEENIDEVIDEEGEDEMDDNCQSKDLVTLNQSDTLNADKLWSNSNVCNNLKLENGFIKLDDISSKGVLETNDFFVEAFSELVPTWNIIIDDSSTLSIFVAIGNSEGYSEYYTMALWRHRYKTSLTEQDDMYGRTSIDTIIPKLDGIDRIKFKVEFAKSDTETTALKNISITTILKDSVNHFDESVLEEKSITVEPRQQLSVPANGNSICSPTSLSMVLNYYNHTESQSVVSGLVFDQGARLYGNWSFNASYAGGFDDLYARVEYIDNLSTLMTYINHDQPVILSIKTSTKAELTGSIMAYPSGHLLVLTGFKQLEGVWYALVSDPAEYEDSNVNRVYELSQLLDAWRGYTYIIKTTPFV